MRIKKRRIEVCGEKNVNWKGDKVGYRTIHQWVARWLGKPEKCLHCGKRANGHGIHWANVSGLYKRDLYDWIRLCPRCHKKFDMERRGLNVSKL